MAATSNPFALGGTWLRCVLPTRCPRDGGILARTNEGLIAAAEFRRSRRARHGRVEVTDAGGGRAWTNPLWI